MDLNGLLSLIKNFTIKIGVTKNNSPSNKSTSNSFASNSTKIKKQNVNIGTSPKEMENIMRVVVEPLSDLAKEIAMSRNSSLAGYTVSEARSLSEQSLSAFQDPSVQQSMIEAAKANILVEDEELRQVLAKLVVKKVAVVSEEDKPSELPSIVYAEAIKIIGKITSNQIKIVTLIFVLKQMKLGGDVAAVEFEKFVDVCIRPFVFFKNRVNDFQHIEFLNIANYSIGASNVRKAYALNYPNVFKRSLDERGIKGMTLSVEKAKIVFSYDETYDAYVTKHIEEKELKLICKKEKLNQEQTRAVLSYWSLRPEQCDVNDTFARMSDTTRALNEMLDNTGVQNSSIENYSLTSVGIAIAISYFEQVVGEKLDHRQWIR